MNILKSKTDEKGRTWNLKLEIVEPTEDCYYEATKWGLEEPKVEYKHQVTSDKVSMVFKNHKDARDYFQAIK